MKKWYDVNKWKFLNVEKKMSGNSWLGRLWGKAPHKAGAGCQSPPWGELGSHRIAEGWQRVHAHARMHTHTCAHTRMHMCMHTYAHAYTCPCICTSTHACTHMHMCMHTHAHTHPCTPPPCPCPPATQAPCRQLPGCPRCRSPPCTREHRQAALREQQCPRPQNSTGAMSPCTARAPPAIGAGAEAESRSGV